MLSLICQILHILWKRPPGFLNPSNTHSKTPRLYSNINQSVQLFASPAHIPTFIGPQKGPRKENRPVQVAPPLSSVCHAQTLLHRRLRPRRRNRERCATGTAHAWENHQWQQEEDIFSRELTYPTLGKGKSSSRIDFSGDMLVPSTVFDCPTILTDCSGSSSVIIRRPQTRIGRCFSQPTAPEVLTHFRPSTFQKSCRSLKDLVL